MGNLTDFVDNYRDTDLSDVFKLNRFVINLEFEAGKYRREAICMKKYLGISSGSTEKIVKLQSWLGNIEEFPLDNLIHNIDKLGTAELSDTFFNSRETRTYIIGIECLLVDADYTELRLTGDIDSERALETFKSCLSYNYKIRLLGIESSVLIPTTNGPLYLIKDFKSDSSSKRITARVPEQASGFDITTEELLSVDKLDMSNNSKIEYIPPFYFANSQIKEIVLGQRVCVIGRSAFAKDFKLAEVELPSSVRVIMHRAFNYCISLRELKFNGDIVAIGDDAFSFCGRLSKVYLPKSIKIYGDRAFAGCDAIKDIYFNRDTEKETVDLLLLLLSKNNSMGCNVHCTESQKLQLECSGISNLISEREITFDIYR